MAASIVEVVDDLITVHISGLLTHDELAAVQKAIVQQLHHAGMVRVLVLTEHFAGWEKGGNWGDISFQADHDGDIEKMAIVGDAKWEELTSIFTARGLRPFPIEYFLSDELDKAREWIALPA
jgi:hypothetical protein